MRRFSMGLLLLFILPAVAFPQMDYPKLPLEIMKSRLHYRLLATKGITYKRDWKYVIMDGKITSQSYSTQITEYDKLGRTKEVVHLYKNGKTSSIDIYEYYPNSLPKKIKRYHPTGYSLGRKEFVYDSLGFLLEETEYDKYNNIIDKVLYQVNHKDTIITENYFDASQALSKTIKKAYSNFNFGRLKWVEEFAPNATLIYRKEIEYKDHKPYRENFYDSTRTYSFYLEYYYSPYGMLSKIEKVYPPSLKYTHYTCIFNEDSLLAGEIKYVKDERAESYFKYTYY